MDRPSSPLSPGETLRMALGSHSQGWLAYQLKVKQPYVWALVHDKRPITPKLAHKLAAIFPEHSAEDWLIAQAKHDAQNPIVS